MISIKNQATSPADVTFSQTAFSGEVSNQFLDYEILVEKDYFSTIMQECYANCINELRQDDAATGEFEAPYPGAPDYPTLEDFINNHFKDFHSFFYTFMKFDFFRAIFKEENPTARFLIASLEEINERDNSLSFQGKVRELQDPHNS